MKHLQLVILAMTTIAQAAHAAILPVTVTAAHDSREWPVSVEVPAGVKFNLSAASGATIPGQSEDIGGGKLRVTFVAPALKAGEKREILINAAQPAMTGVGIELKRSGENLEVLRDGKLFTRYDVTTGPNKPYFYPLMAPGEKQVVRHWPVEKPGGETTDHPHHRGLWFTHGKVNGVDFWAEVGKVGKTVHTGYETVQGGPVYGLMRAKTDWLTPDGKKIAEDVREVRVYPLTNGTLMDYSVTVKAIGGPLTFGDTKEGSFGLRLADSLRAAVEKGKTAEGRIVNANGDKDGKTWGKSAAWVDYYGPVGGATVGVAIFDDPKNPRHPTTWHVRDYGLFAVNPFGLHDFDKKNPPGSGDMTVDEGKTVTFRYHVYLHQGTTEEARIGHLWQTLATPPAAVLK